MLWIEIFLILLMVCVYCGLRYSYKHSTRSGNYGNLCCYSKRTENLVPERAISGICANWTMISQQLDLWLVNLHNTYCRMKYDGNKDIRKIYRHIH